MSEFDRTDDALFNPAKRQEIRNRLEILDTDVVPMPGTDLHGSGTHQYVRIARIKFHCDPQPRFFYMFVESRFLYNAVHDRLQTLEWIRESFDQRSIYIQERIRKPQRSDTLDDYTRVIPPGEGGLWLAIFEEVRDNAVMKDYQRLYVQKGGSSA